MHCIVWYCTTCTILHYIAVSCLSMPEYARVCQSMPEYARVCKSMPEFARVCQRMPEYARVCQSMPEDARVCQRVPESCQSMPKSSPSCPQVVTKMSPSRHQWCPAEPIRYPWSQQIESSDCLYIALWPLYSCSGSESESPVLRTGVIWKSGVVVGRSVVGRDGYKSSWRS